MREKSIIKKRILQYLESKGISKYEFYQKTGVSNGVLSQKSGMSEENTLRFLSYYEDVNPEWLLIGKGDMLKAEERESNKDYKELSEAREKIITLMEKDILRLELELTELKKDS